METAYPGHLPQKAETSKQKTMNTVPGLSLYDYHLPLHMFKSCCCHRFSVVLTHMASRKSHRFTQSQIFGASSSPLDTAKKPRTMTTNTTMKDEFARHADYLNSLNEKRERVVKASRDVTMNSKKVIFQVHRISKYNKDEVLLKAENDLAAVTNQFMSKLVKELQGTDFWKLRRAYTPGVQEFIEAATLCRFCKTGTLLNLSEINSSLLALSDTTIEPLQINVLDYLLGVADVTGELMRLAIGRISDGEIEYAQKICQFVQDLYRELIVIVPLMDDNAEMKKKMEVMLQSAIKIENACFSVHVRGSEYTPLLGTDNPDFSFFGVSDFE